jgi:hypothetical protein
VLDADLWQSRQSAPSLFAQQAEVGSQHSDIEFVGFEFCSEGVDVELINHASGNKAHNVQEICHLLLDRNPDVKRGTALAW